MSFGRLAPRLRVVIVVGGAPVVQSRRLRGGCAKWEGEGGTWPRLPWLHRGADALLRRGGSLVGVVPPGSGGTEVDDPQLPQITSPPSRTCPPPPPTQGPRLRHTRDTLSNAIGDPCRSLPTGRPANVNGGDGDGADIDFHEVVREGPKQGSERGEARQKELKWIVFLLTLSETEYLVC